MIVTSLQESNSRYLHNNCQMQDNSFENTVLQCFRNLIKEKARETNTLTGLRYRAAAIALTNDAIGA